MNDFPTPIVSRYVGGLRVLLAMALIFCALTALLTFFDPPKTGEFWQTCFLLGVPGAFVLAATPYLLFNRIIADENGLRWRGALPIWKSARWDEITDFSIDSAISKFVHQTIETPNGNINLGVDNSFHEEIAALVAARANNAPYREWGVKGLRPAETFALSFVTRELSWLALVLAFAPLTLVALALMRRVWNAPWHDFQAARALSGDWIAALAYLMPPLFLAFFVCGIISIALAPWASSLLLRERVIVTQRGLNFEKREQSLFIAWDELRAVHLLRERARFVDENGEWRMHWHGALRPLIEHYAPAASFDSENDGSDLAPPVRLENGALFYGSRTTALRLLLQLFVPLTITMAASPFLIMFVVAPDDMLRNNPREMWFFVPPLACFCLWIWRLYRRGGLALSDTGIQVRGAWRDRFYRWDEIVEQDGKFAARRGEKLVRLGSWVPTVRTNELRAEIEKRAGQEQPRR